MHAAKRSKVVTGISVEWHANKYSTWNTCMHTQSVTYEGFLQGADKVCVEVCVSVCVCVCIYQVFNSLCFQLHTQMLISWCCLKGKFNPAKVSQTFFFPFLNKKKKACDILLCSFPVPCLHGTIPPGGVCRLLACWSAELFGGGSDGPGVSHLLLHLWAAVEQQQGPSAQVQRSRVYQILHRAGWPECFTFKYIRYTKYI